jgi:ankyrin repeat protein
MVMEMLLDNRANIEAQGRCGETALIWAAKKGHEKVVKMLLDNRANIEAQDKYGRTALI